MAEFHEILGYEVIETLGYGARSTIYAVRNKAGDSFAMKRVVKASPSDQRYIDQAVGEHEVAIQFDHSLLRRSLRLYKQRQVIRISEVSVLMELVEGITLERFRITGHNRLKNLVDICAQVAEGLDAMHAKGYVHADMKPKNVLVDKNYKIKIIDFGQSCKAGSVKERIQGTPDYIAPEQVQRRPIVPETDVFNLGATMYWLLTGKHVPTLIPRGKAGVTIRSDERPIPPTEFAPNIPPALSSLVMDCIETDPVQRPRKMEQVVDRLDIALAQLVRSNSCDLSSQSSTNRHVG